MFSAFDYERRLAKALQQNMSVRLDGRPATVRSWSRRNVTSIIITLDDGSQLKDGVYTAEIILESVTPFSFLLN